VLILDSRVLSRNYGRIFLRSLPEVTVTAIDSVSLLAELRRFY
jgi:ATP-dependent DNA helicase DinG